MDSSRPRQSGVYDEGVSGIVSGWGLTDESDMKSGASLLQSVEVPVTSTKKCRQSYSNVVKINSEIQFCAGLAAGGQDACAGDSGGPYVVRLSDTGYDERSEVHEEFRTHLLGQTTFYWI